MPMSEVQPLWGRGLAAIAVGPGREVTPLNHLGPHNPLEWAVYLGLLALFVIVVVHEMRSRDDLPPWHEGRDGEARPNEAPKSETGSSASGSNEWFDDRDTGP